MGIQLPFLSQVVKNTPVMFPDWQRAMSEPVFLHFYVFPVGTDITDMPPYLDWTGSPLYDGWPSAASRCGNNHTDTTQDKISLITMSTVAGAYTTSTLRFLISDFRFKNYYKVFNKILHIHIYLIFYTVLLNNESCLYDQLLIKDRLHD